MATNNEVELTEQENNRIVVCPIMTTGYTYRQCIKSRCTLWSEASGQCGIKSIVEFAESW